MRLVHALALLLLVHVSTGVVVPAEPLVTWLSDLDFSELEQDFGEPQKNRSVDNHPLFLDGRRFSKGIGTHANSRFKVGLRGQGLRFAATVGIDDEVDARGSVEFKVVGDGQVLWASGMMRGGQPPKEVLVPVEGVHVLELVVADAGDGIDGDHADWAEARVEMKQGQAQPFRRPPEPREVLTPAPRPRPSINGSSVFGARPGSPFLYAVPATGLRPMRFQADGLPAGLSIDPQTGFITGILRSNGIWKIRLRAENAMGKATREWVLHGGAKLALTPPLGWNSWNAFGCEIDAARVRAAADALVTNGLAQHGWTYINIDDCWQGGRDSAGRIQPNARFGDMKALCDYMHSRGLKLGIYSSPGPRTCASHEGSLGHELEDARQYAEWGVDYLKYDWCSYGNLVPNATLEQMQHPFRVMREALDQAPRDIVYSLCQYGMGNVWNWGAQVGGNSWRTTGDIVDTWSSVARQGFGQNGLEKYAGPGGWNDPDMLVLGWVGWSATVRPTRLTPSEQYAHMTLWSMLCAPLLLGCDLTRLDEFTRGLLTNDEVLAVNQDPLGVQAARLFRRGETEVWTKTMQDGSRVAGVFNLGEQETVATLFYHDLRMTPRRVRDLWRQRDLDLGERGISVRIPRHGVFLLRLWE